MKLFHKVHTILLRSSPAFWVVPNRQVLPSRRLYTHIDLSRWLKLQISGNSSDFTQLFSSDLKLTFPYEVPRSWKITWRVAAGKSRGRLITIRLQETQCIVPSMPCTVPHTFGVVDHLDCAMCTRGYRFPWS